MGRFYEKVADRIGKLDADARREQYKALVDEIGFYKSVFDSIDEGIIAFGESGKIKYKNSAASAMFPSLDPEIGAELFSVSAGMERTIAVREIEITYPEHRIVEIKRIGNVIKLRDVTAKRAQDADAIENGRADAVGEMAASMAHEIGNPLNALSLNLQLLKRKYPEETDLAIAQKELERLNGIIREFLGAFRPAKAKLVPGKPSEPLEDAIAALGNVLADRNIKVEVYEPEAIPIVAIDKAQMEQVFFNIIKNALEAMKDGGRIAIEIASDDVSVLVKIRDYGVGMDDKALANLFEPYRTTKKKGTGLGLMISRRIVAAHGGEILVSSEAGKGTQFTIKLPRLEKRVRVLT